METHAAQLTHGTSQAHNVAGARLKLCSLHRNARETAGTQLDLRRINPRCVIRTEGKKKETQGYELALRRIHPRRVIRTEGKKKETQRYELALQRIHPRCGIRTKGKKKEAQGYTLKMLPPGEGDGGGEDSLSANKHQTQW
ncbi:hypothetical protein NDU88_002270 [Pleurodeles waltl]|uniref:Uncharacterized protein n=1 Tax=Pleurodeles waltl TaxID=8319 RepID=A0AAV7NDH6_PLEWA|nr:hypothetical protein NDU88_002270 [Pleurodeles waltl]